MRNLFLSIVLGATAIAFSGCGPSMLGGDGGITGAGGSGNTGSGGTGTASCSSPATCGGNIVGDWDIVDSCFQFTGGSPVGSFCAAGTTDASGLNMTGSVSYLANGTYSANVTIAGSIVMHVPASCLLIEGIQLTCAQLDMSVKNSQAIDPDPSIQSISCSGSSACACTAQMTPQTSVTTGTYVTQGTQLIEDGDEPIGYCVSGQYLYINNSGTGSSASVALRRR